MCRGFNLVEMVVVIAVISIMASIAVPSFTGMIAKMKAQTAASDLQMALMKTRSEALKRNANVTLAVASGGSGWTITAGNNVLDSYTVSGGVSVSGDGLTYNSSGRAGIVSFGIKAVMGSELVERCVSTNLSGLPKVKKSAC